MSPCISLGGILSSNLCGSGMLSFYKFPEDDIPIICASALSTLQGVPAEILEPENSCTDKKAYSDTLMKLGDQFRKNSEVFTSYKIGKGNKLTEESLRLALYSNLLQRLINACFNWKEGTQSCIVHLGTEHVGAFVMFVDRETSRVMKGVQHEACGFVSSNKKAISSHS
ncbi:hypothetical protein GIB67_004214 [Kingdonia uniflora]|uniref:Uncharacterized protein n=1 Tax=Kingdonia uniflora TaxID=39325 RepID=A0A7J7P110_9MAGN|nr:hypothetical protein GIB67_004214 [Kingdonia uniflora]